MGAYHYWPLFVGVSPLEIISLVRSVLFCISVNRVFLPMHSLRVERMPRRYINYSFLIESINKFIGLSLLVTLMSTFLLFFGLKFFGVNLLHSSKQSCNEQFFGTPVK